MCSTMSLFTEVDLHPQWPYKVDVTNLITVANSANRYVWPSKWICTKLIYQINTGKRWATLHKDLMKIWLTKMTCFIIGKTAHFNSWLPVLKYDSVRHMDITVMNTVHDNDLHSM